MGLYRHILSPLSDNQLVVQKKEGIDEKATKDVVTQHQVIKWTVSRHSFLSQVYLNV